MKTLHFTSALAILGLLLQPASALQIELRQIDPCRAGKLALKSVGAQSPYDFAFGQHSQAGGDHVSPDGIIWVGMHGQGTSTGPRARRLVVTVNAVNLGTKFYRRRGACRTNAIVRLDEGTGIGSGAEEVEPMPALLEPNSGARVITFTKQIRGTGNDTPDDWNESYEHVLVSVELDHENKVPESNETNNISGPHCYHAPSNRFVGMSNC